MRFRHRGLHETVQRPPPLGKTLLPAAHAACLTAHTSAHPCTPLRRRKVDEVKDALNAAAGGGVAARRIAAEEGREYILQRDDDEEEQAAASGTQAEPSPSGSQPQTAPLNISFDVSDDGSGGGEGAPWCSAEGAVGCVGAHAAAL